MTTTDSETTPARVPGTVPALVRPVRIQLSRRKGFILQWESRALNGLPCVNVARPGRYGNPHRIGPCPVCGVEHTREEAIAELRAEIVGDAMLQARIREELSGKNVACWCGPADLCHGDVLLEWANA